jgi:hypothetical protein
MLDGGEMSRMFCASDCGRGVMLLATTSAINPEGSAGSFSPFVQDLSQGWVEGV